jgi:hypothetical protein
MHVLVADLDENAAAFVQQIARDVKWTPSVGPLGPVS